MRIAHRGSLMFLTALVLLLSGPQVGAQQVPAASVNPPRERFVPADELETVFAKDGRGVMLQRQEFQRLLELAKAAETTGPQGLVVEQAELSVTPLVQQATVRLKLQVQQFGRGWHVLRIPAGNLSVERAEIGGQAALIARDPADVSALLLAHEAAGSFTVELTLSTPLAQSGSDLAAAFQLPGTAATALTVVCPAGRQLLVNERSLERPTAIDQPAEYRVPAGNAAEVRLRWMTQQRETEVQRLIFVTTAAQLEYRPQSLHWSGESLLSVYGGTISRLTARVPAGFEVVSVESAGLESWTLEDDSERAGGTRVVLTWRQPVQGDRIIGLNGVVVFSAAAGTETAGAGATSLEAVPTVEFSDVSTHSGRLVIRHEDGLRLAAETAGGIRTISSEDSGITNEGIAFEFWQQQYALNIGVRPRDREVLANTTVDLSFADEQATLKSTFLIEVLNLPLFEIPLQLPADWQLSAVRAGDAELRWTPGTQPGAIVVQPPQPIQPGSLQTITVELNRTLADPEVEQRVSLPSVSAPGIVLIGGTWHLRASDDLVISPLQLSGLTAISGTGNDQVFRSEGSAVTGELAIQRKAPQLAARSTLRTWADARQQTLDGELSVDVLTGTIRGLELQVSESLGESLRFEVASVGLVPGLATQRLTGPVRIVEQSAGAVADGLRSYQLRLDRRFAGSLTLRVVAAQPRTENAPINAPIIRLTGAVRQHGVLVFEALPEQALRALLTAEIPGLAAEDAAVVTPPPPDSTRRTALVYRFVQPDYAFQVQVTGYATSAVPSAVCELLTSTCVLSENGTVQRHTEAQLQTSGVQTLRFRLPSENSWLWSTVLDGEPVEVRREGADYLVALPAGDQMEHELEVLFESAVESDGFRLQTQQPLQLLMDAGTQRGAAIEVLQQKWSVHYPEESLILGLEGSYRPLNPLDQSGWLAAAGRLQMPEWGSLPRRLSGPGLYLLVLFVLTVLCQRRRWKTLAGITVCGGLLMFTTLSVRSPMTNFSRQVTSRSMMPPGDGGWEEGAPANKAIDMLTATDSPVTPESPAAPAAAVPPNAMEPMFEKADTSGGLLGGMGGMGGMGAMGGMPGTGGPMGGGGGGFGGGGFGVDGAARGEAETDARFGRAAEGRAAGSGRAANGAVQEFQSLAEGDGLQQVPNAGAMEPQSVEQAVPARGRMLQRGTARLSVQVDLEIPAEYRSLMFLSVADSAGGPAALKLAVRSERQLTVLRLLSALLAIAILWWRRRVGGLRQFGLGCALLLAAIGAVPLLSADQQWLADGVAIGAVCGLLLVLSRSLSGCCTEWCPLTLLRGCCSWKRGAATGLLVLCCVTDAVCAQQAQPGNAAAADVVIPYTPGEPPLRADRIFVPHDQFLQLFEKAHPDQLPRDRRGPLGSPVISAYYRTTQLLPVAGTQSVLRFEGRFVVWRDADDALPIELPLGPVAVRRATVDGAAAVLKPLQLNVERGQLPDFAGQQIPAQQQQQLVTNNAAPAVTTGAAWSVQVAGRGLHVVDLEFDLSAEVDGVVGRCDLPLRNAVAGLLEWTLPGDNLEAKVNGRTTGFRRTDRQVLVPIAAASTLRLQWLPMTEKSDSALTLHSSVTSAVSLQDSGLIVRTSVEALLRQGEINQLAISLPGEYSIQSVGGDDVAGWAVSSWPEGGRSLEVQFKRTVTDRTTVWFQLFAAGPVGEQADFPIPISAVRGSGRDTGTIVLKAGQQFQVRTAALSGVTQLNPDEAPQPAGEALPGRPVAAWRYARQPASVSVRISPTADELTVEALHGLRLEAQRMLWTSRLGLLIRGGARARLDVQIPDGYLPLDVAADGLQDWYIVEPVAGSGAARILSLQLSDARIGQLAIVLQGQQARGTDVTSAVLQPPVLIGATTSSSELAVWLDAASESSGIDAGSDWNLQPAADANGAFREVADQLASLLLRSTAPLPRAVTIRLRPAVSTLVAESLTVASVTETSLEHLLALRWQVARAAADQFAVELPESLAQIMTFEVPGQRRVLRESAGDGRTRIIFQLQQPVSGQLFVLGTASAALPADRQIRMEPPNFVIPANAASTLSGQGHFRVLVNQSRALLQPLTEQPEDVVAADQITLKIPQPLLDQAVLISRLRAESSAWRIVQPERQQVTPAVVSLATHTTVIAEDGSWRSQHQLQVANEGRQFLPVQIPEGARLLFCRVNGQPSRIVQQDGGSGRQLIPLPQSAEAAAGFEVQFALAGRFAESLAELRRQWSTRELQIPVPVFPEFRDDPDYGITINRNRWSVHVPASWRAVIVKNADLTNVTEAAAQEYLDQKLLSEVEQVLSATSRYSGSAAGGQSGGANVWFQQQAVQQGQQRLESLRAAGGAGNQQLEDALRRLSELSVETEGLQQGGGQGYLLGKDLQINADNEQNRMQFFSGNGIQYEAYGLPAKSERGGEAIRGDAPDQSLRFRFMAPEPEAKPQSGVESLERRKAAGKELKADELALLGDAEKAAADQPGMALEAAGRMPRPQGLAKGGRSKSQLRQNALGLERQTTDPAAAGELGEAYSKAEQDKSRDRAPQDAAAMLDAAAPPAPAPMQAPASGAVPGISGEADFDTSLQRSEGLLSLNFQIPEDGVVLTFLRAGGNPRLALQVRSAETVQQGLGLAWALFCGVTAIVVWRTAARGQLLVLLQRMLLLLAVAGLAGLLCAVSPGLQTLAGLAFLVGSLLTAILLIWRQLKALKVG